MPHAASLISQKSHPNRLPMKLTQNDNGKMDQRSRQRISIATKPLNASSCVMIALRAVGLLLAIAAPSAPPAIPPSAPKPPALG
jgi:hypothetical protein